MKLLLTNKTTLVTMRCDEHLAAAMMDLDAEEILWAIGEYARCDATDTQSGHEFVAIEEEYHI